MAASMPASIEKRRLKDTQMYINRIERYGQAIVNRLDLKICGFGKLEKEIYYRTNIRLLNFSLSLFKDKESLYINVVPEQCSEIIQCGIVYGHSEKFIVVKETARYEYEIPFAHIEDPANKLFHEEDKLRLDFRILKGKAIAITPLPFNSAKSYKEFFRLTQDLDVLVKQQKFHPNFRLRVDDDRRILYRKDILAARCKLFYDYLKQNPDSTEFQMSATEELMLQLRNYIILGFIKKPIKVEQTLDIFDLAVYLNILPLCSRLHVILQDIVNAGHVHQIGENRLKIKSVKMLEKVLLKLRDKYRTPTKEEN